MTHLRLVDYDHLWDLWLVGYVFPRFTTIGVVMIMKRIRRISSCEVDQEEKMGS